MKSTANINTPSTQNKNYLSMVFSGEILINKKLMAWYPYFFFLFLLSAILVINEVQIGKKMREIDKLETIYKNTLLELEKNNYFIPYHQNQQLIEKAKERGFVKNEKAVYKVVVSKENE